MTENINIEERLIDLAAWYSNVSRTTVVEIFETVKERGYTDILDYRNMNSIGVDLFPDRQERLGSAAVFGHFRSGLLNYGHFLQLVEMVMRQLGYY